MFAILPPQSALMTATIRILVTATMAEPLYRNATHRTSFNSSSPYNFTAVFTTVLDMDYIHMNIHLNIHMNYIHKFVRRAHWPSYCVKDGRSAYPDHFIGLLLQMACDESDSDPEPFRTLRPSKI